MEKPAAGRFKPAHIAAVAVVIVAVVVAFLAFAGAGVHSKTTAPSTTPRNSTNNTTSLDLYAHLSTATFALLAPNKVYLGNGRFDALALQNYEFFHANASGFAHVENSTFVVLVVNGSDPAYTALALDAVNASVLGYAMNKTNGVILSGSDVWAKGQTVFVLAGYKSANALSSALLSFFVRAPVYAPHQAAGRFASFNGIANGFGANDPIMDAYLGGTYELGPHDTVLKYPYNYYDTFAYLLYYAPVFNKYVPGFHGNESGLGLPMSSMLCIPPPPPPDGSSICIGDYAAMPMLQVGNAWPYTPQTPQWKLDTGDCTFFGITDCIDTEGWAVSGTSPQLPWDEIPSIFYGFTSTLSGIPPSMTGTAGPVDSALPITWWLYGPGSVGESTGGFQASVMTQNETQLLVDANVTMFSTPIGETPIGNFTVYNATNASSTYACGSNLCGMRFNYSIYALLSASSTIPQSATIISPRNYSQIPRSNYVAVLQPINLSTPKVVRTGSRTYYFSYWSVYSELAGNLYYRRFNTSTAAFQVIGPTQVQAVYTSRSLPGAVTVQSGYMAPGTMNTCPPPLNCSGVGGFEPISNVKFTISSIGGARVYSNTTDSEGSFVTPMLPAGCYQITAYKNGYNFIVNPNPLCINGPGGADAITTSAYVFNVSWPTDYPYGGASVGSDIPINLTLLYANGDRAGNVIVHAYAGSGTINGSGITAGNGTASFAWHAGGTSGIYDINFTASGAFIPLQKYSMPVIVYSRNYSQVLIKVSLSNASISSAAGSSFGDLVTVHVCQFTFNLSANATLSCNTPYPATMSISGMPAGMDAVFTPNPAQPASLTLSDMTNLSVQLGNAVANGTYGMEVTATATLPDGTKYNGSAPLMVTVGSHSGSCNSLGAIRGKVYRYGEQTSANVSIHNQAGGSVYDNITYNGLFDTGFILPAGTYNIAAYPPYAANTIYTYGTGTANVTRCATSSVTLGQPPNATSNTTSTTSTTTSTTSSTSTTTVAESYYTCGACNRVLIAGFSCPPGCTKEISCSYGGFECTT